MSKQLFWPLTLVMMGLVFIASNLGLLPSTFWNLWPLILVIVGLGGLLTADRLEWMVDTKKISTASAGGGAAARTSRTTTKAKSRKKK